MIYSLLESNDVSLAKAVSCIIPYYTTQRRNIYICATLTATIERVARMLANTKYIVRETERKRQG